MLEQLHGHASLDEAAPTRPGVGDGREHGGAKIGGEPDDGSCRMVVMQHLELNRHVIDVARHPRGVIGGEPFVG